MLLRNASFAFLATLGGLGLPGPASAQTTISVDVLKNRHPISPYIYGAANATRTQLADLKMPIERYGGNESSSYNWKLNAAGKGNDWYFESYPDSSATPGYRADSILADCKATKSQAMVTIPMLNFVANLGPGRAVLPSFSIGKYGAQTSWDPWDTNAGDGISTKSGNPFIVNNPNDANVPNSPAMSQSWIQHIIASWGLSTAGGLKYYIMDNEPSLWNSTHRDVHPVPETYDEILGDYETYALDIRKADPHAVIVGPEEWGWDGYFYSGRDQAAGASDGYSYYPDQATHGGMAYYPWLLQQLYKYQKSTGKQLLNVLSAHYYPQQGEYSNDDSSGMQTIRNRSTRSLWDPNYVDSSWISDVVQLIPRLQGWVKDYYPGLQTAITEYNWGDDSNLNGGTAQADVLGIFGRQGLNYASRWGVPNTGTPAYLAFKIFTNYDGKASTFGDASVECTVPDPDDISAFASQSSANGSITVMVVNKVTSSEKIDIKIAGSSLLGAATVWQISSAAQTSIKNGPSVATTGGVIKTTVPAQSVTLFVVPAPKLALSIANPGQLDATPHGTVSYSVPGKDPSDSGAAITGAVLKGPQWVTYNGKTLTLSPPAGTSTGKYEVTLAAYETGLVSASVSFEVSVGPAKLLSATFASSTVMSGKSVTLNIELTSPAPEGGCSVALLDSNGLLSFQSPIVIPEGSKATAVPIKGATVTKATNTVLSVSLAGVVISAKVQVVPAT